MTDISKEIRIAVHNAAVRKHYAAERERLERMAIARAFPDQNMTLIYDMQRALMILRSRYEITPSERWRLWGCCGVAIMLTAAMAFDTFNRVTLIYEINLVLSGLGLGLGLAAAAVFAGKATSPHFPDVDRGHDPKQEHGAGDDDTAHVQPLEK